MRAIAVIVTAFFVIGIWPVKGDDDVAKKLEGVWRLTSLKLRIVGDESFETDVFGSNPKGYLIFTTEGRMAAVLSAADRKPPASDADNIALMKSFSAYTGKYTVEHDKWTTKVDVSWNEVYNSQDQVRFFRLEGDLLSVRTPEQSDVLPGKNVVFTLTFVRER
jgi:hypothetical protein